MLIFQQRKLSLEVDYLAIYSLIHAERGWGEDHYSLLCRKDIKKKREKQEKVVLKNYNPTITT